MSQATEEMKQTQSVVVRTLLQNITLIKSCIEMSMTSLIEPDSIINYYYYYHYYQCFTKTSFKLIAVANETEICDTLLANL